MTKYTLWKIKPSKRAAWEEWCKLVMTIHKKEAIETIIEEDLMRESCFIIGDEYVLYVHDTVKGKEKKPANMSRELNKKHFEVLHDCLERVSNVALIGYDLKV